MATLAEVHGTVEATLATGRLGQPVFVRYLIQGAERDEAILAVLVRAADAARRWLDQSLTQLHAIGSLENGQVSATLQFDRGASAQITFARGSYRQLDLMVLGNHGALYHEDSLDGSADLEFHPQLRTVLERALRSGRPEDF
jgi:hypothetical protein